MFTEPDVISREIPYSGIFASIKVTNDWKRTEYLIIPQCITSEGSHWYWVYRKDIESYPTDGKKFEVFFQNLFWFYEDFCDFIIIYMYVWNLESIIIMCFSKFRIQVSETPLHTHARPNKINREQPNWKRFPATNSWHKLNAYNQYIQRSRWLSFRWSSKCMQSSRMEEPVVIGSGPWSGAVKRYSEQGAGTAGWLHIWKICNRRPSKFPIHSTCIATTTTTTRLRANTLPSEAGDSWNTGQH